MEQSTKNKIHNVRISKDFIVATTDNAVAIALYFTNTHVVNETDITRESRNDYYSFLIPKKFCFANEYSNLISIGIIDNKVVCRNSFNREKTIELNATDVIEQLQFQENRRKMLFGRCFLG